MSNKSRNEIVREGDRIEHNEHGELEIKRFTENVVGMGPDGPEREYIVTFTPDSAFGSFEPIEQTETWSELRDGIVEVVERAE